MSERQDKPMTANDIFYLVLVASVFLFVVAMSNSCLSSWQYRDLRNRLERMEQR